MKLKPCPFCGGEAEYIITDIENGDTTRIHRVQCKDTFGCGANIWDSISAWEVGYFDHKDALKARWNRRVQDA